MKQERIEELLTGTLYANGLVANPYCPKRSALYDDAELNAARVQLLAKALRFYATADVGEYVAEGEGSKARQALIEAGLEG